MEGGYAYVNSQVSKSGKRKWTMAEDAVLISCMIDLRNMGTHNADIGFKSGYLSELEKMLLEKLSNCGIKARPHIESLLKTLKKECAIVYDMMLNTSGFGWDSIRKMVTAEDDVWEAYVADRATGKDAQAVEDILQELEIEDLTGAAEEAEVNPSYPNEYANANTPTSGNAVHTMTADMKEAYMMLSKSVHSDIVQEKFLELLGALHSVDDFSTRSHGYSKDNKVNFFVEFFGILLLG
ncbi:hypothetical protein CDL15_Pgr017559 [Punica granatum]|uniref:Myb/SANT-like domain-containing protein n=1 Tax=Punica granatum TaxID=22663 RepID=A0A218W6Z3_PUNGR|nr:hypothetical protein CDL15_Pgr017559 [Punica granatum]